MSNIIEENDFSNPETKKLYQGQWKDNPALKEQYEEGIQCGGCSFFAPLNADYGVCCHKKSKHFKETVFEHFTCEDIVEDPDGWNSHCFREQKVEYFNSENKDA